VFRGEGGSNHAQENKLAKTHLQKGARGIFGGLEKLAEMSNWQTKLLQNLNGRRGRQGAGK